MNRRRNKNFKRIISIFTLAALLFTVAFGGNRVRNVEAGSDYIPKSMTIYKDHYHGSTGLLTIILQKDSKDEYQLSSIKSSNESVAIITSYKREINEFGTIKNNKYTPQNPTYMFQIIFKIKKIGKTTISYKMGNKTYKTKVNVKKYVNPIKNITISGINNNKNLAKLSAKKSFVHIIKKKFDNDLTLNVTAKPGWKIAKIDTGSDRRNACYEFYKFHQHETVSIPCDKGGVIFTITFADSKGNDLEVDYHLNNIKY